MVVAMALPTAYIRERVRALSRPCTSLGDDVIHEMKRLLRCVFHVQEESWHRMLREASLCFSCVRQTDGGPTLTKHTLTELAGTW